MKIKGKVLSKVFAAVISSVLGAGAQTTVHTVPDTTQSTVITTRLPNGEAQRLLEGLIPPTDKHHLATIKVYTPGGVTDRRSLGVSCSSSSDGKVADDGKISMSGSSSCAEKHENIHDAWLGLRDAANPDAGYLITARCVEAYVWDHCEVPPPGTYYNVVIQQEKHGNFKVYIALERKIGGKVKVSTWDVLYVEHVVPKGDGT